MNLRPRAVGMRDASLDVPSEALPGFYKRHSNPRVRRLDAELKYAPPQTGRKVPKPRIAE